MNLICEGSEKERLTRDYWAEIAKKLRIIKRVRKWVRSLLNDYLWNEYFCIRLAKTHWIVIPDEQKHEYDQVCTFLQEHTVREILIVLENYTQDQDLTWTDSNRKYLFKKFNVQPLIKEEI